jgi:Fe-Mn family superoxide dismutase
MTTMTRRDLLSATVGAALVGAAVPAVASSPKASPPRPIPIGQHPVVPLPFAPAKLAGLSEELVTSHHDNNYAGAVKNLNKVELELARTTKDTPPFVIAGLRERELTFTNSMILHEAYFANLGGDGKRPGSLDRALAASFGSIARFEETFRATAMSLGGGSGWVILDLNLHSADLRIYGSGGHSQAVATGVPLLVLDMYEHAYAIDYGAGHARYIDAFFANARWNVVESRLTRARSAASALGR